MDRLTESPKFGALWRSFGVIAVGGAFALLAAIGLPLCPMAAVLGVPCPGCGLTRATVALLHGDLTAALHFHPLVLVIAPIYAYLVTAAAVGYVRGPRPNARVRLWFASRTATALALMLLCATLLVWGARFDGYFGGPVPVETFGHWVRSLRGTLR